jgi:mannitol/fructose-specific phosphotransferase system IIA component (Ntr-type)
MERSDKGTIMKLSKLLTEQLIRVGLSHSDKRGIIEELVGILVSAGKVRDGTELVDAAMEREAKGSTGLADGVAVPHCKVNGINQLLCSMAISREGLDFDSLDGKPSHIFIFLAAPIGMSGPHVRALSNIAALSQRDAFLAKLREASTPHEALGIITEEETSSD